MISKVLCSQKRYNSYLSKSTNDNVCLKFNHFMTEKRTHVQLSSIKPSLGKPHPPNRNNVKHEKVKRKLNKKTQGKATS